MGVVSFVILLELCILVSYHPIVAVTKSLTDHSTYKTLFEETLAHLNILSYGNNSAHFVHDTKRKIVIIVKIHINNVHKVIKWFPELSLVSKSRLVIIGICSHEKSSIVLQRILDLRSQPFYDIHHKAATRTDPSALKIYLIDLPPSVYEEYYKYNNNICKESNKALLRAKFYPNIFLNQFCATIPPLLYSVTDVVIDQVMRSYPNLKFIILMNAEYNNILGFLQAYEGNGGAHRVDVMVSSKPIRKSRREGPIDTEYNHIVSECLGLSIYFLRAWIENCQPRLSMSQNSGLSGNITAMAQQAPRIITAALPASPTLKDFIELDTHFLETVANGTGTAALQDFRLVTVPPLPKNTNLTDVQPQDEFSEASTPVTEFKLKKMSIVISYVIHFPKPHLPESFRTRYSECESNLLFFVRHGVASSLFRRPYDVEVLFTIVGDKKRRIAMLENLPANRPEVKLGKVDRIVPDVVVHRDILERHKGNKTHFIFLDCGIRGPYFRDHSRTGRTWIDHYLHRLTADVHMVAPRVSCHPTSHIASVGVLSDSQGAVLLSSAWTRHSPPPEGRGSGRRHQQDVKQLVDAPALVLDEKANLSVRTFHREFSSYDWSQLSQMCSNPPPAPAQTVTTVTREQEAYEREEEPCESLFVPFGGNSPITLIDRIWREDADTDSLCARSVSPTLPDTDVAALWSILQRFGNNPLSFSKDLKTELVVVSVVTASTVLDVDKVVAELYKFPNMRIRMIVVASTQAVLETLKEKAGSLSAMLSSSSSSNATALLSVVDIPPSMFQEYAAYMSQLCTNNRLGSDEEALRYSKAFLGAYCRSNPPFLYTMVDLLVFYAKKYCLVATNVLVMNVNSKELSMVLTKIQLLTSNPNRSFSPNSHVFDILIVQKSGPDSKQPSSRQVQFVNDVSLLVPTALFLVVNLSCVHSVTATPTHRNNTSLSSVVHCQNQFSFRSLLPPRPSLRSFVELGGRFIRSVSDSHKVIRLNPLTTFPNYSSLSHDMTTSENVSTAFTSSAVASGATVSTDRSVLLSYALFLPVSDDPAIHQCEANLNMFVQYGVTPIVDDANIDIYFQLIGNETRFPDSLEGLALAYGNVHVIRTEQVIVDIIAHANLMRRFMDKKTHFAFLNCGARGPYYYDHGNTGGTWLDHFLSRLVPPVRAVGATISCEVSPHIQSFAMVVDHIAAAIVLDVWTISDAKTKTKLKLIYVGEVGASQAIISAGHNIDALHYRYSGHDFRSPDNICAREAAAMAGARRPAFHLNPIACRFGPDIGCEGLEPCEVVFMKYGGEVLKEGLVPFQTLKTLGERDSSAKHMPICSYLPPVRPAIDVAALWSQLSAIGTNPMMFRSDNSSELVVIVRAYYGYAYQMVSMLMTMKAVSSVKIRALILATEDGSYEILYDILKRFQLVDQADEPHPETTEHWDGLRVSILNITSEIYKNHSTYLSTICTPQARKYFFSIGYGRQQQSRFCEVNSPMHYLFVDSILHYVKTRCLRAKLIIVTNADNTYTPEFFKQVMSHSARKDVVMSHMVHHGTAVKVRPKRGYVDLGTYATSVDFLRNSNLSFIGVIPRRPLANDYHDVDGVFTERLLEYGARIHTLDGYLFNHNR